MDANTLRSDVQSFRPDELLIDTGEDDDRLWVSPPQEPGIKWRPLMIDLAGGNRIELLHAGPGSKLTKHLHSGPVHGFTIRGTWHYLEHDWVAKPGHYLFEPPGDAHTLVNTSDEDMLALFFLFGPLMYMDENDEITGYDDNMTILAKAKAQYVQSGLGAAFIEQFIR